jgi:MraZ protein
MKGFLTECEVTIDAKGRFLIPAGIKKKLPEMGGEAFVIARGLEECLVLYPAKVWEDHVQAKLNTLSDFNPAVRRFKRLFLNGATELEMDGAGRVLVPKSLMEYAGLEPDEAGTLAQQLLGGDININL